jgi:hypothetical protein
MQRYLMIAGLGLALTIPAALPAMAQSPNVQQLLKGLTTGDQSHDKAVRDAFERGYQRGRQDEARQMADRSSRRGNEDYRRGSSDYDRDSDRRYQDSDRYSNNR